VANGPLHGIKVFEVTQIVAGPMCGVHLADLGADVVKVEPPVGDATRGQGGFLPGESKTFHTLNRGKRSLVIDLGSRAGQDLAHQVMPYFDVFVINSRPGVPEKLRLDYDTLRQFRPDLIYMENTGFGREGPSATRAGSDIVAQAYSGLMAGDDKVDEFGGPMLITATAPADQMAGVSAAMGVCAALYHRDRTGEGQKVSTSLLQSALVLQGGTVAKLPVIDAVLQAPMLADLQAARERGASYQEQLAIKGDLFRMIGSAFRLFYRGYVVKDGAIILGALTPTNQDQIRRVLGTIDDDPTRDPNFNALDPASDAIVAQVGQRMRDIMLTKTMDEWLEIFDREGAPASKVNFAEHMADDPQVAAMGYMVDLEHPLTGPERMVGPAVSMSITPTGSMRSSPPLGHHSDEVLAELGVPPAVVASLREQGVVV